MAAAFSLDLTICEIPPDTPTSVASSPPALHCRAMAMARRRSDVPDRGGGSNVPDHGGGSSGNRACVEWLEAQGDRIDDNARAAFLRLNDHAMWQVARQGDVERSKQLIGRITKILRENPGLNVGAQGAPWGRSRKKIRPGSSSVSPWQEEPAGMPEGVVCQW